MYTYTWKKYLPLIRLLLKRSAGAPHSVQLDAMDFDKVRTKNKLPASFKIEIERGRMLTINASVSAKQLYDMLGEDEICRKLTRENKYETSRKADFELAITNRPRG